MAKVTRRKITAACHDFGNGFGRNISQAALWEVYADGRAIGNFKNRHFDATDAAGGFKNRQKYGGVSGTWAQVRDALEAKAAE